jgi:hypothetical protein
LSGVLRGAIQRAPDPAVTVAMAAATGCRQVAEYSGADVGRVVAEPAFPFYREHFKVSTMGRCSRVL